MSEERYLEWLERLEIPIEDTVSIEAFQNYLKEVLGITLTDAQRDALWEATGYEYEILAPLGVRAIYITYPWGKQLRFVIAKMPGLWGWSSVQRFLEEMD